MAIIYSYPDNLNILLTDMLIGTSTIKIAGKKKNITKNFTVEALGKVISNNNPTAWGTIIGNLSDQTDLQAVLDSKQNNITLTTIGSNGPSTLIGSILNIPNYFTVVPTKTSDLINDGEDGVHPFITAEDVTPQVNSDWDATSGVAEILNKPIIPTKTSDLTNDGEDGINPFITLADIPPSTIPNLNDVLLEGNISQLDAKIGSLYLYDTMAVDYARVDITNDIFTVNLASNNPLFQNGIGVSRVWNSIGVEGVIDYSLLTGGRIYSVPDASGTIALLSDIPTQGLTSVGLSMPAAFNVANSPLTSDGTIAVSAAGTSSQYIRGDGQLATLPTGGGGGSSVNYYLNGSIAANVVGYKQLSNVAIVGAGTDFPLTGNGLITQFLSDVGNPNRIQIPGGTWNFEMWFSMSSNGGTPKFYVELLKYNGSIFTSIASTITVPESITGGTNIDLYLTSLAVPTTTLLSTDRLAIRVYIVDNSGGRTVTLHTEDNHLCEVLTTFSGGVTSLNGLTANTQYLSVGTTGSDFNISSLLDTHAFNLPTASATNRGALSTTDWTTFNGKFTLPSLTNGSVLFSNGTTIAQDNSNFFWDDTNNRLGIGTNAPTVTLDVNGQTKINGLTQITGNATTALTLTSGGFSVSRAAISFIDIINATSGKSTFRLASDSANFTDSFYIRNATANTYPFLIFGGTSNVAIGYSSSATDNGGKLQIKAPGALSTDIALRVRNSADTADLMTVGGTSFTSFKSGSVDTYINSNTTLNSSGRFLVLNSVGSSTAWGLMLKISTTTEAARIVSDDGTGNLIIQNSWSTYGMEFNTAGANTRMFISGVLGNIGIGTKTPVASAKVQVDSTTQGFLPPRMTNAQRIAIATPAVGCFI